MRRGWTLVEVVIVLLILAVGAAIALPAYRALTDADEDPLVTATRRMEVLFGLARDSAIRAGTAVTVVIDSAGGQIWLDAREAHGAVDWEVPASTAPGLRGGSARMGPAMRAGAALSRPGAGAEERAGDAVLEMPPGVRLLLPRARSRFTFEPSGAFRGDSLVLEAGGAVRTIHINPWTGDVEVY